MNAERCELTTHDGSGTTLPSAKQPGKPIELSNLTIHVSNLGKSVSNLTIHVSNLGRLLSNLTIHVSNLGKSVSKLMIYLPISGGRRPPRESSRR